MYYHASAIRDIKELEPRISNHEVPLIYFSKKRENVLVYLSNAIEKYCKETNFSYDGIWQKWAAYGFDKDGRQRIEEYYPDAATSSISVKVSDVEFIPDAYTAILEAEQNGLVTIMRYDEMTEKMREWIRETVKKEYEEAVVHPEYRHFLRGNFSNFLGEG